MSLIQFAILFGLAASPVAAFWRLPCKAPLVVERADPIVNPGALSGHVHTIMGGNGFDFTMDYNSTQASTCTSCTVHGDFSNYWTPSLYFRHQDGSFEAVNQVGGATVYYLQRTGSKDTAPLEAFPEGFRMVAGDPYKRSAGTDFPSQAISYNCLDYKLSPPHPETGGFPSYNCPDGLRSQVFFPSCWDGKNLDSADHKSHMAYPVDAYNNGNCPSTHPVHLVSIFYEIIWDTNKFASMWSGSTQPFVWSMGDSTGYGLHGDFVMGWDRDLLQRAVDKCTNDSGRVEDCAEFTLYPDTTAEQCKKPSKVDEVVTGVLEKLPGCNPVTNGPEEASPVKDCAANALSGTSSSAAASIVSSATTISSSLSAAGYESSHSSLSSLPPSSSTKSASISIMTSISTGGIFVQASSTSSVSATSESITTTSDYTTTTSTSAYSPYQSDTNSNPGPKDNESDIGQCAAGPATVTITYTQISTITATAGVVTAQPSSPSEVGGSNDVTSPTNISSSSSITKTKVKAASLTSSISPESTSPISGTSTNIQSTESTAQPTEWSGWSGRKRIAAYHPLHIRADRKRRIR